MPSHTFSGSGKHTVRLTVTDNDANTNYVEKDVISDDTGLVSRFRVRKDDANNLKMWFNGEYSHDAAGADVAYLQWQFGDGGTATEGTPPNPGNYDWLLVTNAGRLTDWSYAGVPGGIPNRTTVYTTIAAGATAATINTALSSCPAGQVVLLSAGTYSLTGINLARNQVTLRGAGPGQTILNASGSGTVISGGSPGFSYSGGTAVSNTSGILKDSKTITVPSGSLPSVGNLICLAQNDDHVLVFVKDTGNWAGSRNLRHVSRVTGVSGRDVTLATPIPYSFSYAQSPTIEIMSPNAVLCGIENMTIRAASDGDCVSFGGADRCWMYKVELTNWGNEGAMFQDCAQCEVRRCYIHTCLNFPTEAEGYGVYTTYGTSDFLIEDNIMYQCSYGVLASGSSRNAIMYNHVWHMGRDAASRFWQQPGFSCNHGPHGIMCLYEGNTMERWQNDGYHGNASYMTLFRNNIHGVNPAYSIDRRIVDLCKGSYYHNVIGNVIGSPTWTPTAYDFPAGTYSRDTDRVIYLLGWPNMGNGSLTPETPFAGYTGGYPDPKVASTILRHANYDYFYHTTHDGDTTAYPIPNSLKYNSKPSWFGSLSWPAIGPDVAGLVKDIPASKRWANYNSSGLLSDLFADMA